MSLYDRMNRFLRLVGDEFRMAPVFLPPNADGNARKTKPKV